MKPIKTIQGFLYFICLLLSGIVVFAAVQVRNQDSRLREDRIREAQRMAEAVTIEFSGRVFDSFFEADPDVPYDELKSVLVLLTQSQLRIDNVYLINRKPDGGLLCLADGRFDLNEAALPGLNNPDVVALIVRVFELGIPMATGYYKVGQDHFMSVFVPIRSTTDQRVIGLMGIDYAGDDLYAVYAQEVMRSVEWGLLVLGISGLLGVGLLLYRNARFEDQVSRQNLDLALHVERINQLASQSRMVVWETDTHGRYTYVSPQAEEVLGVSPDELLGKACVFDHCPDPYRAAYRDRVLGALEQQTAFIDEENPAVSGADGSMVWLLSCGIPFYDKHGALAGLRGTDWDISDRRQQEERASMLFREMLDGFALHEIICDDDGEPIDYLYLAVNPAFERMTGKDASEVIGRRVLEVWPETERDWIRRFGQVALSGEPAFIEDYSQALDKHFEVTAFRPAEGQFACIFQDVSKQWRAQEQLREVSEYQQKLFDYANALIVVWNSERKIMQCNHAFERLTGYTASDVLNQDVLMLFPSEQRNQIFETLVKASEGRHLEAEEIELCCKDGSVRTLLWNTATIDASSGDAVIATIAQGQDITDRKNAEAEQVLLQKQLANAQKMESVGRLAGGVAHDFNNMLQAVLGASEAALEKMSRNQAGYDEVEEIRHVTQRAAHLPRQLLAFARRQPAVPRIVDMNETVDGMLNMLRRLVGENVELVWDPGEVDCHVQVDPMQMDQIMANLLVNARDAIGGVGCVVVKTSVETRRKEHGEDTEVITPGEYVCISVKDNGCGMDEQTVSKIFEPFFTTKPEGVGTGLGLPMVYGIVRQNKGFVRVESRVGRGTTFRLYFPRQTPEARGVVAGGERKLATPVGGSETIMVVEDEPSILKTTTLMLERLGYRVLGAGMPAEAVQLAASCSDRIDLVITDVVMPEMNGRDLAMLLQDRYPDIKCLFMSGYTASVMGEKGIMDETVHFIHKPFTRDELARTIRRIFDDVELKAEVVDAQGSE